MISRSGWTCAVAVVCLMLIAGCSDPKGPVTLPAATSPASRSVTATTAAPSPTPTVTHTPPVLPVAATKRTDAGAEAFVRYFWDTVHYGYESNDPEPLRAASTKACGLCVSITKDMVSNREAGRVYTGGEISVIGTMVQPGDLKSGTFVLALIKQAASSLADSDGAVATAEPADEGSRWHMWLSFTNGKWQITKVLLDTSAQGG